MSATPFRDIRATPEAEFVRAHRAQAEQALFSARFNNWRVSVSAGVAFGGMVSGLYYYLTAEEALLVWLLLHTAGYGFAAAMCLVVEHRKPDPASTEQRWWRYGWTVVTGAIGVITGSLLWCLPPERADLVLSATVIISLAGVGQVVARAYRPMVYAAMLGQTAALCAALVLHANLAWLTPICVLFATFALTFGLTLSRTMLDAIMQRLYAQHLAAELRIAHRSEIELERLRSAQEERERMMEDMHDGLGSALLSTLVLLERKELSVSAAADVVRECVDDLRLIVDSREPAARDLSTLVGMFRYRLQPRVQAAGIRVRWRMDDLPSSPQLDSTNSLHLLRILQEAVTNSLKHSGASTIDLSTRQTDTSIEVTVTDDGSGFDEQRAFPGRGLANVRSRARRLGATLTVASEPGCGTTLTLQLPMPPKT